MVKNEKKKAIFFDRDGVIVRSKVINGKPFAVRSINEFRILPYVIPLIDKLKKKNFLIFVVTNQPDLKTGKLKLQDLNLMHKQLLNKTKIDQIFVCPHNDADNCECRKPKIGLFIQASKVYNINFSKSYLVGDRKKDIEAGNISNCKTIFIDRNYKEEKPTNYNFKVSSFQKAISYIIDDSK